jgi:hypothetical protein
MSDAFISYAGDDRVLAERLHQLIAAAGFSVWWDRELVAGSMFTAEIEQQLRRASAVVVVWTTTSIASPWVAAEADVAAKLGTLVPIRVGDVEPPLPHRMRHTLDLSDLERPGSPASIKSLFAALEQGRNRTTEAYLKASDARVTGRAWSADKLRGVSAAGGSWSQCALVELANHEFARGGDARAIRPLEHLLVQANAPFSRRSVATLLCLCELARGDLAAAQSLVPHIESMDEGLWIANPVQELFVWHGLDNEPRGNAAWRLVTNPSTEQRSLCPPYSWANTSVALDRALLSTVFGSDPVSAIVSSLSRFELRGLTHLTAATSRAIRKSPYILQNIEKIAVRDSWKLWLSVARRRQRCRDLERRLLPVAGTLFAGYAANSDSLAL